MLERIDVTLRETGLMAKLEANVTVDPTKIEQVQELILELDRCRARLHKLREHPDYEYWVFIHNNDIGGDWQRNLHVGANGFAGGYWHWMRRKER